MPQQNRQRQGLLIALVALVAVIGLLAGMFTRIAVTAASFNQTQRQNPQPTATATLTLEASPTATSEATAPPDLAHFTLKLTATPSSGYAGDSIVIKVLATNDATGNPIPGLTCRLRAPTDGVPGLLTSWPTPTATNESGVAAWTVPIPANAPGRYEIEVFAQTPSWSYVARAGTFIKAP